MNKKFISFVGGIHPPHSKRFTEDKPVERCNIPKLLVIPLQQHIGAPCESLVKPGDYVRMGQKIGQPKGYVSAPVHASVSGVVKAIENRPHPGGGQVMSIIIENDDKDMLDDTLLPQDVDRLSPDDLKARVIEAGIVGLGGATFPTHVKLSPPPEKKIDTVILNGAECEPFLTADYRLMLESPKDIISGLKIIMKILGVSKGYIGIEDNKPKAIISMRDAVSNEATTSKEETISIVPLKTKYPQGAEKQLIDATTKRQVPSGGLPMDVGVVVNNVGTAAAIARAVNQGTPLYERIVTVTGGAIKEPKNLIVRIGTSFNEVIEYCGGLLEEPAKVISGGPMMGISQYTLDIPVIKGTSGILLLTKKQAAAPETQPCIRCGKCIGVCPVYLMPFSLSANALKRNYEECERLHALDCIECGCCSFICPAARPLLQSIRIAKREIILSRKRTVKA